MFHAGCLAASLGSAAAAETTATMASRAHRNIRFMWCLRKRGDMGGSKLPERYAVPRRAARDSAVGARRAGRGAPGPPWRSAFWGDHPRSLVLGVRRARKVADRFSTPARPSLVAGSIGPSGMLPSSEDPDLGRMSLDGLLPGFVEQAGGLIVGGADVLILETCQDMLEMKAQILG